MSFLSAALGRNRHPSIERARQSLGVAMATGPMDTWLTGITEMVGEPFCALNFDLKTKVKYK